MIAEGIKNANPSIIQVLKEKEPSTHNKPENQSNKDDHHSLSDEKSQYEGPKKKPR
jgi:hypothetical protein